MSRAELIKRFSDYVYYFNAYCTSDAEDHEMLKAVLALLKEQDAVEPIKTTIRNNILGKDQTYDACGNCGFILYPKSNYCPHCGRKVKWE